MRPHQKAFIELVLSRRVLRFGDFTLKSGRKSPYFFDAGLISDGDALARLGACYADAIAASGLAFDMLFGPAYKGIPLVSATAIALATRHGRSVPFAFNRKEAKDHGEGGRLIGAPLAGGVLIVDDVITAGTAVRESIGIIRGAGAAPAGVVLALDRQERGEGPLSAVQEVQAAFGVPVIRIITLDDLIGHLASAGPSDELAALRNHRAIHGVDSEA
ncbi:MAG TPA: orotate phosphoribosyltransferase [Steroidobacteraceae bacterium]|nr:orotate phosphoribosyltransferase [Steroidobacteraceae bacterium]